MRETGMQMQVEMWGLRTERALLFFYIFSQRLYIMLTQASRPCFCLRRGVLKGSLEGESCRLSWRLILGLFNSIQLKNSRKTFKLLQDSFMKLRLQVGDAKEVNVSAVFQRQELCSWKNLTGQLVRGVRNDAIALSPNQSDG